MNMLNPLGSKGNMARAFATLLHELWHGDLPYLAPYSFRVRPPVPSYSLSSP